MTPLNARAMTDAGIACLRRGDAPAARKTFESVLAASLADATTFLGLAYACSEMRDQGAAMAAVDSALALEPRNLRALMFKGYQLDAAGDAIAAAGFYQAVIKCAPPNVQLPPDLQQLLVNARAKCESRASQLGTSLEQQLATLSTVAGGVPPRFAHSLDILLGRKQIFFQQPRLYYFPELPQIQFFDRANFAWLDELEAATPVIRNELLDVLGDKSAFTPYVQRDASRPSLAEGGMLDNADWSAFYLWKNGELVADNAARCPRTMQALAGVPIAQIPGCSPSILFSQLRPRSRIPPHTGIINTRLICHLPLVVPPDCGFRVGNETREWVEGRAWLFDDTIEHEAWNQSQQTRVILLFEVWRPELTMAERDMVCAMFKVISQQRGAGADWAI